MPEKYSVAIVGLDRGISIAALFLKANYIVSLYNMEIKDEKLDAGEKRVERILQNQVRRGQLSSQAVQNSMRNLASFSNMEAAVKSADLVIEVVPESLPRKQELFTNLDQLTPRHTILATTTSHSYITQLASVTNRPKQVAGMHFLYPIGQIPIVEIIQGVETSITTIQTLKEQVKNIGKTPIVSKDNPGFIVNRINAPLVLWLDLMHDQQEFSPEDIDAAALNAGMRIGYYERLDFFGLDEVYRNAKFFAENIHPDYTPSPSLKNLVKTNNLGKKTGRGYYNWLGQGRPRINRNSKTTFEVLDFHKLFINEAAKLLAEGIATAADIDLGMKLGYNHLTRGPLEYAATFSEDDIIALEIWLDTLSNKYRKDVFLPHKYIREGTLLKILERDVKEVAATIPKTQEWYAPAKQEPIPGKKSDVIETPTEPLSKTITQPPFHCQLCGIKHPTGTPRMQCENCGRFVCTDSFADMARVGRTVCPMCEGKLTPM
ncbi:MAG: hypothetical protein JSV04_11170 [Candidatus Heimdallarchaeota archaeon]|nr:MAG: hypothetical protein JSV04_11170 [Candidatus Heimdallarchaeota archaeon]